MQEKFNEPTLLRPQADRMVDAPLVTIDLFTFSEQITNEKSWKNNDRNAITIFKTNGTSIVLIALHKGAEMVEHTAKGLITLQVLKGKIMFNTTNESIELGKNQMLVLHKGVPHSVVAKKKTVFLLTLTTALVE